MVSIRFFFIASLCALLSCTSGKDVDSLLGKGSGDDIGLGNPALSFSPATHDFGSVRASVDSVTRAIQITNSSTRTVFLSSLSGANSHFTILSHDCPLSPAVFPAGASCSAQVRFAPTSGGSFSMALTANYGIATTTFPYYSSGSVSGKGVTPLVFPGITAIDQNKCKSLRVNWGATSGVGAYLVFDWSSGAPVLVGSTSQGTSLEIGSLTPATNYSFRVYATDELGVLATNSAMLSSATMAAPILTPATDRTFPSGYLTREQAMPVLNFDNTVAGSDTDMSYTCTFDRDVDGAVAAGTSCSALPGTAVFSPTTGVLNWTPSATALGSYEVKVTGSYFSECTAERVLTFAVKENFAMGSLLGYYEAMFARGDRSQPTNATAWKNLATSGSTADGTRAAGTWTGAGWTGDGTVATPFALSLDGTQGNRFSFGGITQAENAFVFNLWMNPANVTDAGKVILGNGGETANGFVLRTSVSDPSKLELHLGNTAGTDYASKVTAKNPTAYWNFDELAGSTAANALGAGLIGTIGSGVALNAPSTIGAAKAFTFGTGASYVDVADNNALDFSTALTISLWVYPTSSSNYQALVGKGTSPYSYLYTFDNGTLYPSLYMTGINETWANRATQQAVLNQWNHIAVTFDAATGEIRHYVNGSPAGAYTATATTMVNTAQALELGNMINHAYPFNGRMDEVSLYARVLTPAEIADLATPSQTCISTSSLQAGNWYLVSGEVNQVTDTAKLYFNGSSECSTTATGLLNPSATPLNVGAKADGTAGWTGKVGMLSVYSSLAPADIADLYYKTVSRYRETPAVVPMNLVFYLDAKFNDGTTWTGAGCTPSVWKDLSLSAFTATLSNFSACDTSSGWNGIGSAADPYRLQVTKASGDHVTIPDTNALDLSGDLSIVMAVRPSGTNTNYRAFLGKGNGTPNYGFLYAMEPGNWKPTLYLDAAHGTWGEPATTALVPGSWSVITVTFKSSTKELKYYLNGNPDGQYITPGSVYGTNARPLEIGTMIDNTYPFEGGIGAVLLYSSALTPAEVKQNCQVFENRFLGLTCAP